MQYYANDVTEESVNSTSYPAEGYVPQYETPLQTENATDEYYSVQPGENYYGEYEEAATAAAVEQPTNFTIDTNENPHNMQPSNAPILEQHQVQPNIENSSDIEQTMNARIPNYLHSDTDDSQTGYQTFPSNNMPPNQDSDFDFSTNSEHN